MTMLFNKGSYLGFINIQHYEVITIPVLSFRFFIGKEYVFSGKIYVLLCFQLGEMAIYLN